jgi:hypothetical protein
MTCADRARHWVEGDLAIEKRDKSVHLMSWRNHYSPKYGKCFLELHYFNNLAKGDKKIALDWFLLVDVIENVDVASTTSSNAEWASTQCFVRDLDSVADCHTAKQFIDDRMSH